MTKDELLMDNGFDDSDGFPGPEDKLFEISKHGQGVEGSAKEDWYHLINGYKDAADCLVVHALETRGDLRKLGNPILFLYRHHLELALKDLIRDCLSLLGREDAFPKTHRIGMLWQTCRSLLDEISPGLCCSEEVGNATRLMLDFQKVDPTSEAFRYPEDKHGNRPLSDKAVFYLETVREVVGKISLMLECISEDISARKEHFF